MPDNPEPIRRHAPRISEELHLKNWQVENTIKLTGEGATVPFVSRYRKEATGGLDETVITAIRDRFSRLVEMDSRRETIIGEIEKQGKLNALLRAQIENASTPAELEDLYLPYRPKKKTRASVAREKGLEELAKLIFNQEDDTDPRAAAAGFLNPEVETIEQALQGARDIIAEWVSEDRHAREIMRGMFSREAIISSRVIKGLEEQGSKYRDYFDFREELKDCPSHRLLAMRRGEKEEYLRVSIEIEEKTAISVLEKALVKSEGKCREQVRLAVEDSFKRLLAPSIETEFDRSSKEAADLGAIEVFSKNLRQLLMAPILGQKRVMGIDPGYRTGCKVVCVGRQGDLLAGDKIYPNPPREDKENSVKKVKKLVKEHGIEAIAIGNGTAGRETRNFIENVEFDREVEIFVVSEAGASIYSASKVAREEFPDQDVTVRGAVSIARRLMDPLAELVKIDPKNLGVGQYQHDVDQGKLKDSLDRVVESCVNLVGVNLNTASRHLLTYISGLGPSMALNIVNFRRDNGPFRSRQELLKVPRMGKKVFVQCAGFLRIQEGTQPLDNTAVHPESYYIVEKIAGDLNCPISDLIGDRELRDRVSLQDYTDNRAGLPTLEDIMEELLKPGRDPRKKITVFKFKKGVNSLEDLEIGMILPGIVTNIANFGAFVDIGVKQDGLVHISELSDGYVKNPVDVVSLHQEIRVKVMDIDLQRKRIRLSLKDAG